MFTRRAIQQCLDEATYAPKKARRNWVNRLNSSDEYERIAAEWEVVVVHTLSRLGQVAHEPKLGGTSQLDVKFTRGNLTFAADVTTVSDRGVHQQNPVQALADELQAIYIAEGIGGGALHLSVTDLSYLFGTAKKKRRLVPPTKEFAKLIFNDAFFSWIRDLKKNPEVATHFDVTYRRPDSRIRFSYVPGRKGSGLHQYTDYRVPSVIDQNPLYYALDAKADQLRKSGFKGKTGIILCDGGTGALRPRISGEINAREIVLRFLQENPDVSFVFTLSLRNLDVSTIRQRVEGEIYTCQTESWQIDLGDVFSNLLKILPRARQTADNARSEIKHAEARPRAHLGALKVSYDSPFTRTVTMSTRTLMDLLLGRLSAETLNRYYKHGDGEKGLFQNLAEAGLLIRSAAVRRNEEEDEDEIELTFTGPDPAASPFRLRPTRSNEASDPETA